MNRFADKKIIISGGGTGIGRASALAFAREGARVVIVGLEEDSLREVSSRAPDHIQSVVCDIRDSVKWISLLGNHPDVGVLVNNAGVSVVTDLINDDRGSWETAFSVNFEGALTGSRTVAPLMRGRGGRIVNVTSIHGNLCEFGSAAYSVSKAALNQATRCLAVELSTWGILVNGIAPGFVETAMSYANGTNELKTDSFQNNFIKNGRIPLRRAAQPEEIASAILFLASEENTYITGHILTVDGGLTLTL